MPVVPTLSRAKSAIRRLGRSLNITGRDWRWFGSPLLPGHAALAGAAISGPSRLGALLPGHGTGYAASLDVHLADSGSGPVPWTGWRWNWPGSMVLS